MRSARELMSRVPWHPVGFATAFILSSYTSAMPHIHAVFRPLAISILASLAVLVGLWLVIRNRHTAGIGTSLLIAGVLLSQDDSSLLAFALLLIVLAPLLWLAARVRGRPFRPATGTGILNTLATALLAVAAIGAVLAGVPQRAVADVVSSRARALEASSAERRSAELPSIYVILLDAYARADTLSRRYGFDNGPFLRALEERGFDVASRSRSNYMFTQYTLPSMFHMRHVVGMPEFEALDPDRRPAVVRSAVNANPTFDLLRASGYEVIATDPGIEYVSLRSADVFLDERHVSEFEYHLIRSTAARPLLSIFAPDFLASQHRSRVLRAFGHLGEVARASREAQPRFMFAHVMSPHAPLVFHADGSPRAVPSIDGFFSDSPAARGEEPAEAARAYVGQLRYVNTLVLDAIDLLLKSDPSPPVVIVMSDHGPAAHIDFEDMDQDAIDERFPILFAAYTPRRDAVFEDWITPVNIFPRLMNAYLGTQLRTAPDATYVSTVDGFVEVANPDAGPP